MQERMALPFGVGVALTLDEWALLMELDDVYWSDEGILSVQVTLGTTGAAGGADARAPAAGARRAQVVRRSSWLRA